jgi:hypothetical protein
VSTFNSKRLRKGERRVRRHCGDAGESGGQYGAGPGCILFILFNPQKFSVFICYHSDPKSHLRCKVSYSQEFDVDIKAKICDMTIPQRLLAGYLIQKYVVSRSDFRI